MPKPNATAQKHPHWLEPGGQTGEASYQDRPQHTTTRAAAISKGNIFYSHGSEACTCAPAARPENALGLGQRTEPTQDGGQASRETLHSGTEADGHEAGRL